MQTLLNPKWLFVINTLPIAVLFVLFSGQFNIIKTLLNENSIELWKSFGMALGGLGLLNFTYALYLVRRKQRVSVWYGVAALLLYIGFLYVYGYYVDKIIPSSVPQWMILGDVPLYVGTFLMPTLAYSLFILVAHWTPNTKEHKAWVDFLVVIAIPIVGYLFVQIILPLWKPFRGEFTAHVLLVLIIAATLVFLFFLVRGIVILATTRAIVLQKYQLAWKIPLALVLPMVGLLLNNGHFFHPLGRSSSGIFGDFGSHWFYILAIANGIVLCLPNLDNKRYRLFLFIGRSITFTYTFYFFLVFLPFLPVSVVAIIAMGVGFLLLTPLLLFVLHTNELSADFSYLKTPFSKHLLISISLLGFLVIPIFITITYLKDKSVLHETLGYVYSPDYSKQYSIDKHSLQKTLDVIKSHKDHRGSRGGPFGNGQPFLSSYFTWLVLDNLTLSDAKINYMEKIFFGTASFELQPENIRNNNVKITNIKANSSYDKSQNAWKSWIDLEITNKNKDAWFSEYATTITLPEGCWISDYYLYVGEKKEFGILAEKKAAMWVFSNIRNENRDPGILYYLTGNKVAFRVFPFTKDEVRKTGIEFLHKEPVTLTIDGNVVALGSVEVSESGGMDTENVVYVSAKQKQSLQSIQRKPYFHFIVDVSRGKEKLVADAAKRIDAVVANNKPLSENAQISFVNSYVTSFALDRNWKHHYQMQSFEGGFYVDRAIKSILFNVYKSKAYPVIVVVTDSIQHAILDKDFSDFKCAFPESNLFFNLGDDGRLQAHSLIDNPARPLPDSVAYSFDDTVLEYQLSDNSIAYLPDNKQPSIILKNDRLRGSEEAIKAKSWRSALIMQGNWMAQVLHPETSDKALLDLVAYSFASRVMTPVTSYLVVENEAQKAILKKKQEQVLAGNTSLDLDEETQRMSEPNLWGLAILLGIALWYKQKRQGQRR